ncbi:MAG: hypothetical protein U5L76_05435 [Patescibacteria group bacterium]|nr:hypothetical protein [Patescibacteria group bacterium]
MKKRTIAVVISVILVIFILGYVFLNNADFQDLKCSNDSDCINTCCGCLHKDSKECDDVKCFFLPKRNCICAEGQCIEKTSNYVALEDIIGEEENYVGKEIQTTGNIVEAPGFKIYYVLLNKKMIEENVHPYTQGLDVHYPNSDIEKIVSYDCPETRPREYIKRDSSLSPLFIKGVIIDRGKDIRDMARYSLKILEIKELDIKN